MNNDLRQKLIYLADKYETCSFTYEDPCQFLRWYDLSRPAEVETASFIAAMLAFGSRTQFIPKIQLILKMADCSGGIVEWIKTDCYKKDFYYPEEPENLQKKFYRFYSYLDMQIFFEELGNILRNSTLGDFFCKKWQEAKLSSDEKNPAVLSDIISAAFPKSKLVPKGKNSASKRIWMFLRWMVRKNSPVDLGLWTWADPCELLIPLDVHVMQEAASLGLIPENSTASRKTAVLLTKELNQVFLGDPCRADYALFGLGVDKNREASL